MGNTICCKHGFPSSSSSQPPPPPPAPQNALPAAASTSQDRALAASEAEEETQILTTIGGRQIFQEEAYLKAFTSDEFYMVINGETVGKGSRETTQHIYQGWVNPVTLAHCSSTANPRMMITFNERKLSGPDRQQAFQQWLAEAKFLKVHDHPNLLHPLGFYRPNDSALFVAYNFCENGSLGDLLAKSNISKKRVLSWEERLKILIGAARALDFLHNLDPRGAYYPCFNSNKILLYENYEAKLTRFGFTPLCQSTYSERETELGISSRGRERIGLYSGPERFQSGDVSSKSDVYGFGVVLIEVLKWKYARKAYNVVFKTECDIDILEDINLEGGTRDSEKRVLAGIIDQELNNQCSLKALLQFLALIKKCTAKLPASRPSMHEVLESLEAIRGMDEKKVRFNFKKSIIY